MTRCALWSEKGHVDFQDFRTVSRFRDFKNVKIAKGVMHIRDELEG
ncbi:hypothetical protein [Sneathiella sp.]